MSCSVSGSNMLSELRGPKRWNVFGVISHVNFWRSSRSAQNFMMTVCRYVSKFQQSQAQIKPINLLLNCSIVFLAPELVVLMQLFFINVLITNILLTHRTFFLCTTHVSQSFLIIYNKSPLNRCRGVRVR